MTAREPSELFADAEVSALRVPPHSIEAECCVLGSLLLSNGLWDRLGDVVVAEDFYRHEHRLIFAAAAGLLAVNKPADVVTVFEQLQNLGKAADIGGLTYLTSLAQFVPSAGNLLRYAEIVRERAILRRLVAASDQISSLAFNCQGQTVDQILDTAEAAVCGIGLARTADANDWEDMATGVTRLLTKLESEAAGTSAPDFVPTGLTALDHRLDGGLRPGELVVIGARPSMGKSALGLSISLNVAQAGHAVGFMSMEMPTPQVQARAMAVVSHIHLSRLKRGERLRDLDWAGIASGAELLRKLPLFVSGRSALNINQLRSKARMLKRQHGLRVLVVDYLGLMAGLDPRQLRTYQLEDITKGLKGLAKELGITVLLLVQVSRKVEERVDQMPQLSDLRDSGAIEQDADVVLFVHRPHKANPMLGDEWRCYAKACVAKLRDGEPGYFDLHYTGEHTHFADWPADLPVPSNRMLVKRNGGDL